MVVSKSIVYSFNILLGEFSVNILLALLLSISGNLDNIVFGVNYGVSKVKITMKVSMIISIFTTVITAIFMVFGMFLGAIMPIKIADRIGGILLIAIGVYFMISGFISSPEKQVKSDEKIYTKKAILLACGLCVNNIPIAVVAGISNASIIWTSIFSLVFGSLFIFIGNIIGRKLNSIYLSAITSFLLIILGILKCL